MKMEIIITMARHTRMKIHFSLNTMNSGIITTSMWQSTTPRPPKTVNSLLVYTKFKIKTKKFEITISVKVVKAKNTVNVRAAAIRTLLAD